MATFIFHINSRPGCRFGSVFLNSQHQVLQDKHWGTDKPNLFKTCLIQPTCAEMRAGTEGSRRGITPLSVWTSGLFTGQDSALYMPTLTHRAPRDTCFRCHRGKIAGADCHGNMRPRRRLLGEMPKWPSSVCICVCERLREAKWHALCTQCQLSVSLPAWQTGRVC